MSEFVSIAPTVRLGKDVKLSKFINLYGCEIGDETKIGAFVEIQKNARVGRRCKISSHTFICEGVDIEDNVFVGHSVTFINDLYPRATTVSGELQSEADWKVEKTLVKKGASIGSGLDDFGQCYDRRERHRWRWKCSEKGCPGKRHCCGESRQIFAVHFRGEEIIPMTNVSKIPFLDLVSPHQELETELLAVVKTAFDHGGFYRRPNGRRV